MNERDREQQLTTGDLAGHREQTRARGDEELRARAESERAVQSPQPPASPATPPRSTETAVTGGGTRELARAAAAREERPASSREMLFPGEEAEQLRRRWSDVQGAFVDEPRRAVERADELVAQVMKRLAEAFATERANLEKQWDRGDKVTTEDLRVALQRYRAFFDRLLSM